MKFLCDVHIPYKLVSLLQTKGYDAIHVNNLPEKWYTTDSAICDFADKNGYVVITKDNDFKNSHLINNTPKKLIRILLGNVSNNSLLSVFNLYLDDMLKAFNSNDKCMIELAKNHIEVNIN
jgi:predicted nuclease of predicted toxin-antitoxin system